MLDATREHGRQGKYIREGDHLNVQVVGPFLIAGVYRVAIVSGQVIKAGDQLVMVSRHNFCCTLRSSFAATDHPLLCFSARRGAARGMYVHSRRMCDSLHFNVAQNVPTEPLPVKREFL